MAIGTSRVFAQHEKRELPVVFHPEYVSPLPAGHRFPMSKFGHLFEILREEGIATRDNVRQPERCTVEMLAQCHEAAYVTAFVNGTLDARAMRRIGLPWSQALVHRTMRAVGGTVLTARLALRYGMALNCAGGTHHAHPAFGSGFCIFNDLAVTATVLLAEEIIETVLILDADVHQGDGTAVALAAEPRAMTVSIHCGANFPFRKATSDLDVSLPAGTDDEGYVTSMEETLARSLEECQQRWGSAPDLVLYDAGVDVHRDDRLGKLALSDAGIWRRDELVLSSFAARAIPVGVVIGGGYDQDHRRLADRHATVHRVAHTVWHQSQ